MLKAQGVMGNLCNAIFTSSICFTAHSVTNGMKIQKESNSLTTDPTQNNGLQTELNGANITVRHMNCMQTLCSHVELQHIFLDWIHTDKYDLNV